MTKIQWTDVTDNIIVADGGGWWCRMISPGCANCYAARLNQNSFYGGNKLPYSGNPPKLILRKDILADWARQRKPKRHFVASMTDVFGEWVTPGMAWQFLDGMASAPMQTFQILTKRPSMAAYLIDNYLRLTNTNGLPPNVWVGVSVENQMTADVRITELLKIPAAVRFLSVEPMLEKIDLKLPHRDAPGPTIDWVIFGGESGPGARVCNIDWIQEGVEQCRATGVAPFVKQLGKYPVADAPGNLVTDLKLNDSKGGDPTEWPPDLNVREFPRT